MSFEFSRVRNAHLQVNMAFEPLRKSWSFEFLGTRKAHQQINQDLRFFATIELYNKRVGALVALGAFQFCTAPQSRAFLRGG